MLRDHCGARPGLARDDPGPAQTASGTTRTTQGSGCFPGNFLDLSREVYVNIRKEYEGGRSLQDLANELGVAKSTVGEFLKSQGVKLRPRGRPRKLQARDDGERV